MPIFIPHSRLPFRVCISLQGILFFLRANRTNSRMSLLISPSLEKIRKMSQQKMRKKLSWYLLSFYPFHKCVQRSMRKFSAQQTTICVFFELAFVKFCSCSASSLEKLKSTRTKKKINIPWSLEKKSLRQWRTKFQQQKFKNFFSYFSFFVNFLLSYFFKHPFLNPYFGFEVFFCSSKKLPSKFCACRTKICVGPLHFFCLFLRC